MAAKNLQEQLANMGWEMDNEFTDCGELVWRLKNQDDFLMDFVWPDEGETFYVRSTISTPDSFEDVWSLWDVMAPFFAKEEQKLNYLEWDGSYGETITVTKYYNANKKLPLQWMDGRRLRGIIGKQLRFHRRAEQKLTAAIQELPSRKSAAYSHLTPENSIRLYYAGMHGALPSLQDAVAYYDKYVQVMYGQTPSRCKLFSNLSHIVLYNLRYRNYLREHGIEAMATKLLKEAPILKLKDVRIILNHMWNMLGGKLGDVDIRLMGRRETVEILGETFHGVDDFFSDDKKLSVCTLRHPYPCFDEFDAMYEDRASRVTCFAHDEKDLPTHSQMNRFLNLIWPPALEQVNPSMLPLVYDSGSSPVVYLITPRNETKTDE